MRGLKRESMKPFFFPVYQSVFFLIFVMTAATIAFSLAAPAKKLTIYCWRGYDTGSYIPSPDYQGFFKRAFEGHDVIFDDQPGKARILSMIQKADIVYTNSHSGYPSSSNLTEHILQVGPEGSSGYKLTALELAQLRRNIGLENLPRLVVISGCNMISLPEEGGRVLRIPEGFGFTPQSKGRAFLGFDGTVPGFRGDGFFRVFFATWAQKRKDGSYPTLSEAVDESVRFIKDWTAKYGNNDRLYMSTPNAGVGEKVIIVGDSSLRFPDLL
ncbi:MAG: hypothetical protein JXB26_09555 [Candidatus Aminicenantes bacterium]|nr:hypothetical protein [Candidatus Aminicenantes bacterium]